MLFSKTFTDQMTDVQANEEARLFYEEKVRAVIRHYDELTDEELAREIETAPEITGETLISVPTALLPAVRKLIVRHQQSA